MGFSMGMTFFLHKFENIHGATHRHYYYRLKGEYSVPMTPRGGWFKRYTSEETTPKAPGNAPRRSTSTRKPQRKRLILSQTMVIEIDPNKVNIHSEFAFTSP